MTCGVWIGFDEKKSLGAKESGAQAALPMWIDFMKTALAGKDPGHFSRHRVRHLIPKEHPWIRPTRPRRKMKFIDCAAFFTALPGPA